MWRCWSIGIPFLLYILLFPFMRIGFVQRWMNRLFPNNPVMILLRPVRMCFNDLLPPLFPMEQYLDEVVVSTKKIEKKKRYAIESLMAHSDWNKTYHVDEMTLSPYSSTKDLLINTPGVGWAVDSNSGDFFYITRLRAGRSSTPPPALLMVDGLETSYSELVGIPVSIVESIELVKDAAQMAYIGSKASNGAILISTKSGLGTDW